MYNITKDLHAEKATNHTISDFFYSADNNNLQYSKIIYLQDEKSWSRLFLLYSRTMFKSHKVYAPVALYQLCARLAVLSLVYESNKIATGTVRAGYSWSRRICICHFSVHTNKVLHTLTHPRSYYLQFSLSRSPFKLRLPSRVILCS